MYRIFGPKGRLIVRSATLARVKAILAGLRRRFGKVRVVNLNPPPGPFTMYDSITVTEIPPTAAAVAGYVNGHWPTFPTLAQTHPHAKRLSIAVTASADADCLDIEQGDATPADAAAWVKRQHARGVERPVVYTSLSQAKAVLAALKAAGIQRNQIRLWTAHYTFRPHRCTPLCQFGFWARADATQYTDKALGKTLDASLCAPRFLP